MKLYTKMDSATSYLSKNWYFNICHGKNSNVTAVDKFKKFRVDTPLNIRINSNNLNQVENFVNLGVLWQKMVHV